MRTPRRGKPAFSAMLPPGFAICAVRAICPAARAGGDFSAFFFYLRVFTFGARYAILASESEGLPCAEPTDTFL